jgi:hypothetical protein
VDPSRDLGRDMADHTGACLDRTGIGTFYLYYPAVNTGDYFSTGRMAHSDPLQFWAEMGVLAPLLFYGFIIAACAATRRAPEKCCGG